MLVDSLTLRTDAYETNKASNGCCMKVWLLCHTGHSEATTLVSTLVIVRGQTAGGRVIGIPWERCVSMKISFNLNLKKFL